MPIKLTEMDERVSFREQLQQETGSVVLINTFTVPRKMPIGCSRCGPRMPRS